MVDGAHKLTKSDFPGNTLLLDPLTLGVGPLDSLSFARLFVRPFVC